MLKPAGIFSDNMVLQREKQINIWGKAAPGEKITAELAGIRASTLAGADGSWSLVLPPQSAGRGYTLELMCPDEHICFSNVCIGELWLAGGQSNMEYLLDFDCRCDEVYAGEMNPDIRMYTQPEISYDGQDRDFDYRHEGFWRCCTKQDLPYFSAVGYYFASELQKSIDVPVGVICCSWGGTPACAWMDPSCIRDNEGRVWLEEYEQRCAALDLEQYKKEFRSNPANDRTNMLADPTMRKVKKVGLTREEQLIIMSQPQVERVMGPYSPMRPGGLYETMLKKLYPIAIRGVIWYQGETDGDYHPKEYYTVFSRLIRCWRKLWQEELPFLFVQLAPFEEWLSCSGENYHIVREAQARVSKSVPGAFMASSSDAGMRWDIHPRNKKPIGERLGKLARRYIYCQDIPADAPEAERAAGSEDTVTVYFRNGSGMYIKDAELKSMYGVRENGQRSALTEAEITNDTLVLHGCAGIRALEYCSEPYYESNLYNEAGIPALPFRLRVE